MHTSSWRPSAAVVNRARFSIRKSHHALRCRSALRSTPSNRLLQKKADIWRCTRPQHSRTRHACDCRTVCQHEWIICELTPPKLYSGMLAHLALRQHTKRTSARSFLQSTHSSAQRMPLQAPCTRRTCLLFNTSTAKC